MRLALALVAITASLVLYIHLVVSTTASAYLGPDNVSESELNAIVQGDGSLPGYEMISSDAGEDSWRPGPITVAFSRAVHEDGEGNRVAIELVATGSRWARSGLRYARDAICLSELTTGCNPQFNLNRYEATAPSADVGEKIVAAERQNGELRTRSDTFVRSGVLVTVTVQGTGELSGVSAQLLSAIDEQLITLAQKHNIRIDERVR
jgi:hypothetical protein